MSSAALELQKAVFSALAGDAALAAALGGTARIHDHAPASVAFPYLTFGRLETSDWSTATEDGHEHVFTVHAWSKARGKAQVLAIMAAIGDVLHDAAPGLAGHHLVNLRLEFEEVRFDDDIDVHHGLMRFRAATEPAD